MAEPPVPIKDLRLLDVKLGQLPTWLASLNYTPRAFLESCKRGHNRFYAKYWEPKRCGISGPAMLLSAYVVFSYYLVYDRLIVKRITALIQLATESFSESGFPFLDLSEGHKTGFHDPESVARHLNFDHGDAATVEERWRKYH